MSPAKLAVPRGLAFLGASRAADGSLPTRVFRDRTLRGFSVLNPTCFTSALAAWALSAVPGDVSTGLQRGLWNHLAASREPSGLWRYWPVGMLFVDEDADVTACAAAVLAGAERLDAAEATRATLIAHRDGDGRFLTWVRAAGARNDVDAVVNANVCWWLGDDDRAAAAAAWVVRCVAEAHEVAWSPYYDAPAALWYAAARASTRCHALKAAADAVETRVRATLEQAAVLAVLPVLEAAQALSALVLLERGTASERAALRRFILEAQDADGGWAACPAWCGPEAGPPRTLWWGSRELTTAFCVEALARTAGHSADAT